MRTAVITGSGGLIGSTACRVFSDRAERVIGIDNDARARFFGSSASTAWVSERLRAELPNFEHVPADVRDEAALQEVFERFGSDVELVVHTAAQPSHDWAAREPTTDFSINANGTLAVLEAVRRWCPEAVFVFTSTNKVYGDTPNSLPLVEHESRWELDPSHRWAERGIDETMSIDTSLHSLFGVSKAAADLLVQEYARYFGMRTTVLRAGCITGPAHSGTELHGFLAHLLRCTVTGTPYRLYGYKGKQVRDNLHAEDLVSAVVEIFEDPKPGAVFNIGGGRFSNCSVLEAIEICEEVAGRGLDWTYDDEARRGDHIWWISDTAKLESEYPNWSRKYDLPAILEAMYESGRSRWVE